MDEELVAEPVTRATPSKVVTNDFAMEVARYFKIFLETDLRGDLLPIRQSSVSYKNGLKTQLNLSKYSQLNKNLYKNLTSGFGQEAFIVSQNKYVTHNDERINDLLAAAIDHVNDADIAQLASSIARAIDACRLKHIEERDAYIFEAMDRIYQIIASDLVVPMLRANQFDTEENGIPIQDEATEKLYGSFLPVIKTLAEQYYQKEWSFATLQNSLKSAINAASVKLVLSELLDELSVNDAYQEMYQLYRNNQSLATTDLYLYYGTISVGKNNFPLFYMPLTLNHNYPSISITFENNIYVNTKALHYALQEYNRMMQVDLEYTDEITEIFSIDPKNRRELMPTLQHLVDKISDTFELGKQLKLETATDQIVGNSIIKLDNRLQLSIYDKSHESIINDYQEILKPGSSTASEFADLIDAITLREPVKYIQEIKEGWEEKSLNEKLMSANPVPLNDEQKQAMMALAKKESKVVVVNGAPGTGKTHFVSGVVAQSFLDGFTTLVLSDAPAVIETIQNDVTSLLSEVREEAYHNPLLRLGHIGDDFLDDIEGQYVQKLHKYHELYEKLQTDLRGAKKRKIEEISDTLNTLIQDTENINLHEVEQIVTNEAKYGGRDWIRDEPIEEINSDLQRLHQAVQYIRRSDANYLLPYIETSQQKLIADFIKIIREYERANRNVHQRLPEFILRYRKLLNDQKARLQNALSYIHSNYRQYVKILSEDPITTRLDITESSTFNTVADKQLLINKLVDVAERAAKTLSSDKKQNTRIINELLAYETSPEEVIAAINNYIEQVMSLKSKIFGFSGRTLVIENLTRQLKKTIPQFNIHEPEKNLDDLQQIVDLVSFIIEQLAQRGLEIDSWKEVLHILKTDKTHLKELNRIIRSIMQPADFEFMGRYRIHDADNLLANITLLQCAAEMNTVFSANPNLSTLFGIRTIGQVLKQPDAYSSRFNKLAHDLDDVEHLDEYKKIIKNFIKTYPAASKRLGVNYVAGNLDIIDDTFAESSTEEIKEYLAFKKKEQDITSYFRLITSDSYSKATNDLKQITAVQLSHIMDGKFIKYIESHAADFNEIKKALTNKQKISASAFNNLQVAFPCVLADIRDYATYIPLKSGQFDIVIIDEASRISIAEAMPALMRAKKIVIVGDDKQFTNLQAENVSTMLNAMHKNKIVTTLTNVLRDIPVDSKNSSIIKVKENFDVKHSILQFARTVANNEHTFTKHFRSSADIISFVNKHFYGDSMKCLKARALPLNESIKFDYVDKSAAQNESLHTNHAEAQQIMDALSNMKDAKYEGTIGIITPYFEQSVLIQALINEAVINDWFVKRRLKVMTFDTCQGEERDYVFYSMVATRNIDREESLFPAKISGEAADTPEKRLAVGMSCATSVLHFVLSQPIEKYTGAIGSMLQFYQVRLSTGSAKKTGNTTDILLAGESLLPQYFYATNFYKKYSDKARLVTQFSLGELLKQLLPRYRHPSYKVDFMVAFGDQRIIITYDEFRDNFLAGEIGIKDAANYLSPTDIYNQKVLEGYGYKFLRLNKFNLGNKPIDTLDKMLSESIKPNTWARDNGFMPKL